MNPSFSLPTPFSCSPITSITCFLILTPPPTPTLRPSPKLVLIALQLCRVALPLMTVVDCSQVVVPSHLSLAPPSLPCPSIKNKGKKLAADMVNLLLAKLAEYIVPDASQVIEMFTHKIFCLSFDAKFYSTLCELSLAADGR